MRDRVRGAVRPARRLRRRHDGRLQDPDEERVLGLDDLLEDIRTGRTFRVHDAVSGADCTQRVLLEVLAHALLPTRRPAAGSSGGVDDRLSSRRWGPGPGGAFP